MDYLQAAASMNNMGVVSMSQRGGQRAALAYYKAALESLCTKVQCSTPTLACTAVPRTFGNCQGSNLPFVPVSLGATCLSADASSFTFSKAFVFNTSVRLLEEYLESYQAVILFNVALLYDNRGDNAPTSYEAKALELYINTLDILLCPQAITLDCSNVVIAALNNKAQIFFRRSDFVNTRDSLVELAIHLHKTFVIDGNKSMDEHDINGLLLNVQSQVYVHCAPCA